MAVSDQHKVETEKGQYWSIQRFLNSPRVATNPLKYKDMHSLLMNSTVSSSGWGKN